MIKILYVDDESINLDLFELNFDDDYQVYLASSAKEGLAILENNDIGVVITDLKMPEMNGMEFIIEIKKRYPNTVCILLTAFMETNIMLKAINEKLVFKYLLKPWKKEMLKKTIDKAFELYGDDKRKSS